MPYYLANNDVVKKFLLTFFIDNKDSSDRKPEFLNGISSFLNSFEDIDKLRNEDYILKDSDIQTVLNIVNENYEQSDGKVITVAEAIDDQLRFKEQLKRIDIHDFLVGSFISNVNAINYSHIPHSTNYDLALRVYMGYRKLKTDLNYGVLIVPIISQKDRVHDFDKEKELFVKPEECFALAIASDIKSVIGKKEKDAGIWDDITANADKGFSDTQLEFFSVYNFNKFRDGIPAGIRKVMRISFGRKVTTNSISAMIGFLDSLGRELPSDALTSGLTPIGIFFNQGDLIPPPPVSDKSF